MDCHRFDQLTRLLGGLPRRSLLSAVASLTLTALPGQVMDEGAARKKKRKHRRKKKSRGCTPACSGKSCGDDDGCGDRCLTIRGCSAGQTCDNQGRCVGGPCVPDCTGKRCGEGDGCNGVCTFCPPGQTCQGNQCVDDVCIPDCDGKTCGDNDGCDGVCDGPGGCPEGEGCCPDGCKDLLNDDSNCLYCGYDCGVYEDGSCCCRGACMAPGSPYCECECCRIDEDD